MGVWFLAAVEGEGLGRVIPTSHQPVVRTASTGWTEIKQRPGPRLTHNTAIQETVSEEKNNLILRMMSPKTLGFLCFSEVLKLLFGVRS